MKTSSVTDLKNNLSARLKGVIAGEPLIVTDRRKPVAIFQSLSESVDDKRLAGLVASGTVRPPKTRLNVKTLLALKRGACAVSLSRAIAEDREGR